MKRRIPTAANALSLFVAAMTAFPCSVLAETTLERVKRTDRIEVAVADENPYGYLTESGELTGESPAIARAVLERIDPGIELDGRAKDWGKLITSLRAGRVDVIAAGMFITPERCEQVAFTDPTYVVGESFLVEQGNPHAIADYHSISNNPETRVGLVAGTVEYNYAMHSGIPAERAQLYRDFDKAVTALRRGEVDAVGLTSLTARSLARRMPEADLEATEQFYPVVRGEEKKGYGAFAFRKDDEAIVAAFNEVLAEFVDTEAHWNLVEEFGFAPEMAPDKTADELCNGAG